MERVRKKAADERPALWILSVFATWLFLILPLIYLPRSQSNIVYLGFSVLEWTAIGAIATVLYCILTAALLGVAWYQLQSVRSDAKINRTLAICEKYDLDPVLDGITSRLSQGFVSNEIRHRPRQFRSDIKSLFNYFESIAIGVSRGVYDADIVRLHLEPIIFEYLDDFVTSGIAGNVGIEIGEGSDQCFNEVVCLARHWKASAL